MGDAADDRRRFVAGVYAESGPRLYRYALMILADRQDAEDVVQQVFAAVLSKRTLPLIDEVGVYFRTAVRNAAYSLLRQRRTARGAEELMLEPSSRAARRPSRRRWSRRCARCRPNSARWCTSMSTKG